MKAALLACLFLGPVAGGAAPRPVTLGLVAPPSEPDATSLLHGVQLAVADANESGDAPVGLEVRSGDGQWGSVGNDAVVLACDRHVDAIIAPSDGAATHLILQVSGRTRVPVVSVCADSSVTDAGIPWAVRVVPPTDQEAGALFAAAQRPEHPPFHWWAVVPAGIPGRAVRRDLEAAARLTSSRLDRIEDGNGPRADPASLVHLIIAAAPDGVMLWLPPAQAGAFAAALRVAGYGGRLAGPSPLDSSTFMDAAGAAANGVWVVKYRTGAESIARAEQFGIHFRRKFGVQPDASAAAAYDAARVLIETLRRVGEGTGCRGFSFALPTAGVTGILHFDDFGNRLGALEVLSCQKGRFVPINAN